MPLPSGRIERPLAAASASTARMVMPRKLGTRGPCGLGGAGGDGRRRADRRTCEPTAFSGRGLRARHRGLPRHRLFQDVMSERVQVGDRQVVQIVGVLRDQCRRRDVLRQVLGNVEDAQRFAGHDFENRRRGLAAESGFAVRAVQRHHHHHLRIGDRREAHVRAVVGVGVVLGGVIEDLRGAGLAAAGIAGQAGAAAGADEHHAFHHLAHRDGVLGLEDAHRGCYGLRAIAALQHQARLHQHAAIGDDRRGLRQLQRGHADFLAHAIPTPATSCPSAPAGTPCRAIRRAAAGPSSDRSRSASCSRTC